MAAAPAAHAAASRHVVRSGGSLAGASPDGGGGASAVSLGGLSGAKSGFSEVAGASDATSVAFTSMVVGGRRRLFGGSLCSSAI